MSKYYKFLQAGRYCMAVAYSRPTQKDSPQARAEKKKHSTKARQLLNDKASRLQLTGIIAKNFADSKTAFFVSPDFNEDNYPQLNKSSEYWDFCIREAKKYVSRLNYLVKKRGKELRYVYCPGVGDDGRWHIHMLIDGCTAEDIVAAWTLGNANYHRLYADKKWMSDRDWRNKKTKNVNPVAIAKYFLSNASCRLLGKHPWHASKNCERPTVQPARVIHDSTDIQPPDGAEILSYDKTESLYSSFEFYEYILPESTGKRNRRGAGAETLELGGE